MKTIFLNIFFVNTKFCNTALLCFFCILPLLFYISGIFLSLLIYCKTFIQLNVNFKTNFPSIRAVCDFNFLQHFDFLIFVTFNFSNYFFKSCKANFILCNIFSFWSISYLTVLNLASQNYLIEYYTRWPAYAAYASAYHWSKCVFLQIYIMLDQVLFDKLKNHKSWFYSWYEKPMLCIFPSLHWQHKVTLKNMLG